MTKKRSRCCPNCNSENCFSETHDHVPRTITLCPDCGYFESRKAVCKSGATYVQLEGGYDISHADWDFVKIKRPYGYYVLENVTGGVTTGVLIDEKDYHEVVDEFKSSKLAYDIKLTINSFRNKVRNQEVFTFNLRDREEFILEDRITDPH